MEIIRNNNEFKIKLPPYKINIKEIKNKNGKGYQYTSILPPILCSFFEVSTGTTSAPEDYSNILMFMELKDFNIIISGNQFNKALTDQHVHNNLEIVSNYGTPDPELVQYCNDNPINFKLFDSIHYKEQHNTKVYRLSNSNSYRVTLPNQLFKPHIQHTKDNYILFTIDTTKEDLQKNKGIITYEIKN